MSDKKLTRANTPELNLLEFQTISEDKKIIWVEKESPQKGTIDSNNIHPGVEDSVPGEAKIEVCHF
jgi:hypothetical protein